MNYVLKVLAKVVCINACLNILYLHKFYLYFLQIHVLISIGVLRFHNLLLLYKPLSNTVSRVIHQFCILHFASLHQCNVVIRVVFVCLMLE